MHAISLPAGPFPFYSRDKLTVANAKFALFYSRSARLNLLLHISCNTATAFFVIVNYMDNSTLYCTSVNLFESLEKATTFCVITGKSIAIDYD